MESDSPGQWNLQVSIAQGRFDVYGQSSTRLPRYLDLNLNLNLDLNLVGPDPAPHAPRVWAGLRPCSPDGIPYIGRFSGYPNLIAVTGHAMIGMSLAPITGQLVAQIAQGQKPSLPLQLMSRTGIDEN